jgi:ADP-ribose pyrophosphatase YjhB (NUDIX family)
MPRIRTDVVDAYVFRRAGAIELLQLRRVEAPLDGTWHPVMGHLETGETATACMWRELHEETGLTPSGALGAWALEQVHPFFLADRDEIVMSPRFAVEVGAGWAPTLNGEHDAHRWVPIDEAPDRVPLARAARRDRRAAVHAHRPQRPRAPLPPRSALSPITRSRA